MHHAWPFRTWIEDVRPTASLCRDLLAAIGLCPTGRVAGTGLADMPEDLFAALQAAAQCAPANDLVEDIALSKTAAEAALIRELGLVALTPVFRPCWTMRVLG